MAKICLVTHFFLPHIGGIERIAAEQCKRLSNFGYQISVLTGKTHKQDEQYLEGMKIFTYPVLSLADRAGLPYPVPSFKTYKILAEVASKSDIVHVNGHPYISSWIASKVAKKYKKPLILTQHNTFIDFQSWLNIVENLND